MTQASSATVHSAASLDKNSVENRLSHVAVFGAVGKMGNGIAWVLLQAMAQLDASSNGVPGSGQYELVLIDRDWAGLKKLQSYLASQLQKEGEKRISTLRHWARKRADLIENRDIIEAYVEGALSCLRCDTHLDAAEKALLVFEAVFENLEVKQKLYSELKSLCSPETYYLTNTSSLPISVLSRAVGLQGKMIGYHFYNPPAVQKLVEVITTPDTDPGLAELAQKLGKVFGKILVPSHDVAGFIGNGHFIREGLFALQQFQELRSTWETHEALWLVNKTTQDFMIRPMGIFQLLDYVGLDVFSMILEVMGRYLVGETFASPALTEILEKGVRGGQAGSGEQKNGFFQYEKNKIVGVFDFKTSQYIAMGDESGFAKVEKWLGSLPSHHAPWNKLSKDAKAKEKLATYFSSLATHSSEGAKLARKFLIQSRRIAENLVTSGVAPKRENVSDVLTNGFFHLYSPFDVTFQETLA